MASALMEQIESGDIELWREAMRDISSVLELEIDPEQRLFARHLQQQVKTLIDNEGG